MIKNTSPLRQRLRLVWAAWFRSYLFGPALVITDALLDGDAEMDSTVVYKDGSTRTLRITVRTIDEQTNND